MPKRRSFRRRDRKGGYVSINARGQRNPYYLEETNVVRFPGRRGRKTSILATAVVVAVTVLLVVGIMTFNFSGKGLAQSSQSSPEYREAFDVCGTVRITCVVDGDTIWLRGTKIRIADIDTPEISSPKCQDEYDLGIEARDRLVELLDDSPFELRGIGSRDKDQYGRKLRVLMRDGQSIGDLLVEEGLARTWTGRRQPWCY